MGAIGDAVYGASDGGGLPSFDEFLAFVIIAAGLICFGIAMAWLGRATDAYERWREDRSPGWREARRLEAREQPPLSGIHIAVRLIGFALVVNGGVGLLITGKNWPLFFSALGVLIFLCSSLELKARRETARP